MGRVLLLMMTSLLLAVFSFSGCNKCSKEPAQDDSGMMQPGMQPGEQVPPPAGEEIKVEPAAPEGEPEPRAGE